MKSGRRALLKQLATGIALVPLISRSSLAASGDSGCGKPQDSAGYRTERNKQVIVDSYEKRQREALPPTLPGDPGPSPEPPRRWRHYLCMEWPAGEPELLHKIVGGWHAQSVAPPMHAYGPMIAEGDYVVEEWETYFRGLDGTTYSNQYCWVRQFRDGEIIENHEYVDSLHAFVLLGLHADWPMPQPATAPRLRRQSAPGYIPPKEPLAEIETIFPVRMEYELDPRLLHDIIPSAKPPQQFPDTVEGNRALVQAMRNAQACGDAAGVAACHGHGYRHFIAGEGPFGWEHRPLEELYAPLVKHLASPLKVRLGPMVAENGAVFEEMDVIATLDDGSIYNNWHCFIHEIRDGLIVQTREYMDTLHFWSTLSRWASWGQDLPPPMNHVRRSNLPYVRASYQVKNPYLELDRWKLLPAAI